MQYFGGGGVEEADKCVGNFDGDIFRVKEPGVVAAVTDEILVLDAGVGSVRVQRCGWKMGRMHL
jgi:hypothetical protein